MSRTDHGGGPIFSTRSRMRVCSMFGQAALVTLGGIGPLTTSVMLSAVAGSAVVLMACHDTVTWRTIRRLTGPGTERYPAPSCIDIPNRAYQIHRIYRELGPPAA